MEAFELEAIALGETFQLLIKVCHQVMSSDKLPDLLEMVRDIGNRMNQGRGDEAAAGFKLDFLPRLAQTKGSDRKTTALDLVVMIFIARNQREALMLSADFPECQEASRMQMADLLGEVKRLGGALRKCAKELDSLKQDASLLTGKPPISRGKVAFDSKSESALDQRGTRKNLRSSETEVRTDVSSMHREVFDKRSQFINTILKGCAPPTSADAEGEVKCDAPSVGELLKAVHTTNSKKEESALSPRTSLLASQEKKEANSRPSEETRGDTVYNLDGSIRRIEKFLDEANYVLPKLEAQRDEAIEACKELSEFFCETGGANATSNLLGILSEFATNLDRFVKKHDAQQKVEARKKASQKKKSQLATPYQQNKASETSNMEEKGGDKKSLVFMVNEMLKIAGDKIRTDFMNGVIYEQPDDNLQKIYELEQTRHEPQSGSPRRDILRTIEERRQLRGEQDAQVALSELAQAMERRSKQEGVQETSDGSANQSKDARENSGDPISLSTTSELASILHKKRATLAETGGNQEVADLNTASSLEYSVDSSESKESVTAPQKSRPTATERRKSSIVARWTRKIEDDEVSDEPFLVGKAREDGDSNSDTLEKTDSDILAADSHDSEDKKMEEKRRQQYLDRWARKDTIVEAASCDLEEESDVGVSSEILNRTRQLYINRWASKPDTEDEESSVHESDFLEYIM
jgi:hypothetical protein